MKKNVLALSIAAAVGSFGFAGAAHAVGALGSATTTATGLAVNPNGIGQILVVPYFTTQGTNVTLINLVNTDAVNAKAVKVRFRGASNSDDVMDFQVFLSPNDVWSAKIANNGTVSTLESGDTSCTKPTVPGAIHPFNTQRLDGGATSTTNGVQTREGYVEIFNMADIAPGTALFTAVKHPTNAAPPCSGAAWTALDNDFATVAAAQAGGLSEPTSSLLANWMIVDTAKATTFAGAATAIATQTAPGVWGGAGNIVYWPQNDYCVGTGIACVLPSAATAAAVTPFSADPLLRLTSAGGVPASNYDLPDLSTPYTTAANAAADPAAFQAADVSGSIATTNILNEFLTNTTITASTDWVLSFPTRRYSVGFDYVAGVARYTTLPTAYFTTGNTSVSGRQVCVSGTTPTSYDREENSAITSTTTVFSPAPLGAAPAALCGEVSVLTMNVANPTASSVLGATLAIRGVMANNGAYADGWVNLTTPGATVGQGLPVLGASFEKASLVGGNTIGAVLPHRTALVR